MKQALPLVILFVAILAFGESHAQSMKSTGASIPIVDYCKLISNPELYDQKTIRVRGIYVRSGSATSTFHASKCEESDSTWVEFDDSYESRTASKLTRRLARMEHDSQPRSTKHNGGVIIVTILRAEVTFVGTFEAALPARVGKEHDFVDLTKSTDSKAGIEISSVKTDYAHRGNYQHLFTVHQVDEVKPISSKAPW